jgi:hypothetical protein
MPEDVVDWVLVELRIGTTRSSSVALRAAFLKSDGMVVDIDGNSPVIFNNLTNQEYYILIHHRNHLAIMSKNPVTLSENSPLYDFTTGQDKAYGTDAMANLGSGKFGLFAGDGDSNGIINILDYSSVGNFIFQSGYLRGDLDMNNIINVIDYGKSSNAMFKATQIPN